MDPFRIVEPTSKRVPILISSPHSGTAFPSEIKENYNQDAIAAPDDTDWFIDKLYDFAPKLGITMITAHFSRWVIDLNRDPESNPLYDDGRVITDLCPTMNFMEEPIYKENQLPDRKEIDRRLDTYYWPYYHKIQSMLDDLKKEFGQVLLWDAHSIRQYVPTIRKEVFPDLILGDNDEKSAGQDLIQTSLSGLGESKLKLNHNNPFKGGHITRYFGKPSNKQHALQLEMTKVNYMNDDEQHYNDDRASVIRSILINNFEGLIEKLTSQ